LTVLAEAEEAEFCFVEPISGLTKGNLSAHVSRLEEAGYLTVRKFFRAKIPATALKITVLGRKALRGYRKQLRAALR